MFSSADLSLVLGKCAAKNHRRLPVSIFSVKIGRFRVFEADYWKDFSKFVNNFKEAS
jgi:hypothetical protein